jgi:hypothetical protein
MEHDISREIKMIEVQETKFVEDKVKEDLGDLLVDGKSASLKNKNGFW